MSLLTRYKPYSVFLNTAGSVDAWINQIQSTNIAPGISLFAETSGSEVDTQFVASKQIFPSIAISNTDLSALGTVGFNGVFISPGSGTPGATIYARQVPIGGLPAAIGSSDHITCVVSDGLLVPQSVRASNNSVAQLSMMLHATLGTTATYSNATPLVYTTAQTISSGQTATSNIYTGGPIKFTISGGSSYLNAGIINQSVDFAIKVNVESTNSNVYPGFVSIDARSTTMEFTTKDAGLIATIGDGVSVSAFAEYFTNVAQNGQRVAPSTDTHVSIAGTAGMLTPTALTLSHASTGESQFRYTPSFSTQLITISVAATIPTS